MGKKVKTAALGFDLVLDVDTPTEAWRVSTLLTKEAGTIAWLDTIQPGEVVYDIGANIGLYAILAAKKSGTGKVYAFEPHAVNAGKLLRNVALNGVQRQVRLITDALHEEECYAMFCYQHLDAGSPGSQFGHTKLERGGHFPPEALEIKHGTSLDRLIKQGVIVPPTRIKLDVDGNEGLVLKGMRHLLLDTTVQSVQVEIHPASRDEIDRLLSIADFEAGAPHYTEFGKEAIAEGAPMEKVFYNLVYTRRSQYAVRRGGP